MHNQGKIGCKHSVVSVRGHLYGWKDLNTRIKARGDSKLYGHAKARGYISSIILYIYMGIVLDDFQEQKVTDNPTNSMLRDGI